jgi:hypothetical protein
MFIKIIYMKHILSFLSLLSFAFCFQSCHPKLTAQRTVYNREVRDEHGNPMLLGKCTRAGLAQPPYNSWFEKNYADYTVDSATADLLRAKLAGKQLRIFMGTWCGDSRREVPRIFKILDYCGVAPSAIQLIMVNDTDSAYKQSPGHEEKGLNIFRVPDLLVCKGDLELGRIVESPRVSLEKDLLVILNGDAYEPQYPGGAFMIRLFHEKSPAEMEKELSAMAAQVGALVSSPGELRSYGHVLQAAGEKDKARVVLELNSLIFPQGNLLSK